MGPHAKGVVAERWMSPAAHESVRNQIKAKCPFDDDHLVSDRRIDEMFKLEARYERERAAAAASRRMTSSRQGGA